MACDLGVGFSSVKTDGEKGTHDAGEDGDGEAAAEGEVSLAGLSHVFGRNLVLLEVAGEAVDGDGHEAEGDTAENELAGWLVKDGAELAVKNGWNEGAEDSGEAEGDGVAEGEAEVADGKAEGESADAP